MKKIILEDRFTTHQKITFLIYMGFPFLSGIIISIFKNLNSTGYLVITCCILIYGMLISIAFLKRGFVKINSDLYKGSFLLGKLIFKQKIVLTGYPKVAVLKFKKTQKLAWFSGAKPDLATNFNSFEINILNENHTKRNPILDLRNEENVAKLLDFLTSNFDLINEVYSPKFKYPKSQR